jgi:flagellar protein FlbT
VTKPFHISLKSGERIYVNGAVLRVDRKVSIEFLNEVTFLLESHVLQPEQTTTPLRQLYFIVQMILIEPANADLARDMFQGSIGQLRNMFKRAEIRDTLADVEVLVRDGRTFEALKRIRRLFALEDEILSHGSVKLPASTSQALPQTEAV